MALTVFGARRANQDTELWGTDGTTGRTSLIKDINTVSNGTGGTLSGNVGNFSAGTATALPFAVVGNFAYFSATDGITGQELYRTDGTADGTTKVTEFSTTAGTTGFSPRNIVATSNGLIFFLGEGPAATNPGTSPARSGIWKYDPAAGGAPTFVTADSGINAMIAVGNRIYWTVDQSSLSTSDGTTTSLNIASGPASVLYDAGGTVYFGTATTSLKVVLPATPTTATTVTGVATGAIESIVHTSTHVYITNIQNSKFYVGTIGSTTVSELGGVGFIDYNFSPGVHTLGFVGLGNKLIFSNNKTGSTGVGAGTGGELWISDGTVGGTTVLKDIVPGLGNSNPHNFINVNNTHVFFQATNGNGSVELWKTDGTNAGTVLVETLFGGGMHASNPGIAPPGEISNLRVSNGVLYFSFDNGVHGMELWRSDGTAAGTLMLKELNADILDSGNQIATPGGASLGATGVLIGWSQATGYELFSTNGTAAGTALLKDITPGGGHSLPTNFVVAGTKAYFNAFSPTAGNELWVTDGTAAGTFMVKDINPGLGGAHPQGMVAVGSNIYFLADNGVNGQELWISDGTTAGTVLLKDIATGSSGGVPNSSNPGGFVAAGSNVFFMASTPAEGRELYVTNGTTAGTVLVKNIGPGSADASPSFTGLVSYNNQVFFGAQDTATNGVELWVSNGTSGGTVMLKNINTAANESSSPTDFVLANGKFFFRAVTSGSTSDVYVSDGTAPNTVAVTSGLSTLGTLVASNNKVFFRGTGTGGDELYVTSGGSATLLDIFPGISGSNAGVLGMVAFGTGVLFSAQSSTSSGNELWFSDGGAVGAGTFMVKNINTGANASSFPQNFMVVGTKAYFVADDGVNGLELWVTDGTGPGTSLVKNFGPGSGGGSVSLVRAVSSSHLLIRAIDGASGVEELWITNGTEAGTFKSTDLFTPQGSFDPSSGTELGLTAGGSFASVPHTLPQGATGETFNGTPNPDYFDGLGGSDTINGLGGDDVLFGGANNDVLDGGSGTDTMAGGLGDDVFVTDSASDVVSEAAGQGFDAVYTTVSYTLANGNNVEGLGILVPAGTTAIDLTGNELNNLIQGNAGTNVINGGAGADVMEGLGGTDYYVVDSALDQVIETPTGGWDAIYTSISYTLAIGNNVEGLAVLVPSGTTAINLTGNELSNLISGNNGVNFIDGRGGGDVMEGLGGNDVYFVDNSGDVVNENLASGTFDVVYTTTSYTLTVGSQVEGLATANPGATTAINLSGNDISNYIVGNAGANVIDGGGGADTLEGAGGNDVYFLDNAADTIIETSGNGTFDVAYTSVSYTLGANDVEGLATSNPSSTSGVNLVGNAIGNYIVGNAGANILDGKGGADTLEGGAGVDFYAFSSALGPGNNDTVVGFVSGVDKIVLDDAVFGVLTPGSLPAGAFRIGTSAQDADDRIIYDPANGNLFYDADGNGGGAATLFATLQGAPTILATDFIVN